MSTKHAHPYDWTLAGFIAEAILCDFVAHLEGDTSDPFDFRVGVESQCRAFRIAPICWADEHVSNFDVAGNDGTPDRRDRFDEAHRFAIFPPTDAMIFQCIIEEVLERGLMCSSEDIHRADEAGAHPLIAVVSGGFA